MKVILTVVLLFISATSHAFVPRKNTFDHDVLINLTQDKIYLFDKFDNKYEIVPDCSFQSFNPSDNIYVHFSRRNIAAADIILRKQVENKQQTIQRCKVVSFSML